MTFSRMRLWSALALAVFVGACTGQTRPAPTGTTPAGSVATADLPVAKIVAFADLSEEDAAPVVYPAFQAAGVAVDAAEGSERLRFDLQIEPVDTEGDAEVTAELVDEVAKDPEVVAAIVSPFVPRSAPIVDGLGDAGIATVSLSTLAGGPESASAEAWRRMVAPQSLQAVALVNTARALAGDRRGVCLVGEPGPATRGLFRPMARSLDGAVAMRTVIEGDPEEAAPAVTERIAAQGCRAVVWSGFAAGAAALRTALSESGLRRVRLLVSDGAKAQEYLDLAGPAAEGSRASCSCVDLTTSTELPDQRFINLFQFDVGATPGAYAVEGWDAGRLLASLIAEGATTRSEIAAALAEVDGYSGLAGEYRFGRDGELLPAFQAVRTSRAEGSRWIPEGSLRGEAALG